MGGGMGGGIDYVSPIFDEGENRYPNVIQTPIHVPSPRNRVSKAAASPSTLTSMSSTSSTVAVVAVSRAVVNSLSKKTPFKPF